MAQYSRTRVAHLHERDLELVGHAVERLEFVGARVEAEALGLGDGVGDGAHVVRGEVGGDDVDVLEEEERQLFVVGVGFGFPLPDRDRPVALAGKDGLVVPVGALHEADVERAPVSPRPGDQIAEVALGVAQVRLHGDAHRRLMGELRFLEDGFEEREGEVLQLVALHVEVDQRADLGGPAEDRTEALLEGDDGVFRIRRVDVGRERGNFDRKIETRERAVGAEIAEGGRRLAREELGDRVEHLEVSPEKDVGLGGAHHRFAEEIDGRGEAKFRVAADLLDEVLTRFAGDELVGHVDDLRLDGRGDEAGGKGGGGEAGLQRGVQLDCLVAEIFLQVANDFGGGLKGGEDVDEAEQLRLERRVLHGPLHQPGVGALFGKQRRRRLLVHEGEQFFAFGLDGGFELGIGDKKFGHRDFSGEFSPVS